MFENYNAHSVKELLITALAALSVYFTSIYFLPFLVFVFPVAFIVLGVKRGIGHSLIALLLSCIGIYVLEGIEGAVLMLIITSIVAYPMIYAIKKDFSSFKAICIVTILCVLIVLGMSFIMSGLKGIDILDGLENSVKDSVNSQIELVKKMNLNISVEEFKTLMESGVTTMMALLPSILFIMTMSIAMLNYYLSTSILRRIGFGLLNAPKFRNFKLPSDITKGALVMILGVFLLKFLGFGYTTELSLNVTMVFSFLFIMQGVAVVLYLLRDKFNPILVSIVVLISLFLNFRLIYLIIGVMDTGLDLRYRFGRKKDD